MFEQNILRIFCQLILAALFGSLIGLERRQIGKAAGMRTFALVCVGAALFTILSYQGLAGATQVDGTRIESQIVVGIGFIGAGISDALSWSSARFDYRRWDLGGRRGWYGDWFWHVSNFFCGYASYFANFISFRSV